MTTLPVPAFALAPGLGAEVLAHLDDQIASAQRMLQSVLAQAGAIKAREVDTVLRHVSDLQAESVAREALETERARLLTTAARMLGTAPGEVTLEAMAALMGPEEGRAAKERSAHLRGLLAEVAREHACNRVLMRQELAFLDHLMRLVGDEPEGAYGAGGRPRPGRRPGSSPYRMLDRTV